MSPEPKYKLAVASTVPVVCYVTDRKGLAAADPGGALISSIRSAIAGGVDWVQIREPDLSASHMLALARAAVLAARAHRGVRSAPLRVLINDRLDVALAAGAAGVHLGRQSTPATRVVRWCHKGNSPAEFLIGVSCHSVAEVREAGEAGASYAIFGPIFDTPSKRPFGQPQGIAKLREACGAVRIPVIAIGGVDKQNAAECVRAGAFGIAAIRLFQEAGDSKSLAERVATLHELRARA
ncbi:MAG: thiamine phosphate synthase [Candidatus Acidiferrales bacterium]